MDYVVDRNGKQIDIVNNDTFILPVALNMMLMEQRESAQSSHLEDIMHLARVSVDHKIAKIYDDDETHVMTIVKDGEGIFKQNSKGEWVKAKDNSLKTARSTFFFAQHQTLIYAGFLCSLFPELGRIYVNCRGMEINHCIIPSDGFRYPAVCSEFFEIIDRSRNCNHQWYVYKWNLYDCPVSAFDTTRLTELFRKNDISMFDDPYDPDSINNFLDVFIDARFNNLKKKLTTWWYFLNKHTDMNEGVWRAFRQFLSKAYPDSKLLSDECIKKTLDNQIEL